MSSNTWTQVNAICPSGSCAMMDLLISLLFFAIIALVLYGWGGLLTRLFRFRLPNAEGNFSQLWLGWAVVLLLLQLLNFVMPLNWLATTLVVTGGIIALWFNRRAGTQGVSAFFPLTKQHILYLGVLLLSTCWIALQSMREPTIGDTGLYHLQSVRWYNEYAIVPGLGNLHGRLAFNQSFFAFAAALNFYPYLTFGNALANGFLILLFVAEGLHALLLRREERSLSRFAAIFTLPTILFLVLRQGISSPAPDTASTILQFVLWIYFVRVLEGNPSTYVTWTRIHVIFILSAAAVTLKLSNIFFVAVIGLILFVIASRLEVRPLRMRIASTIRLFWFPLLLLIVWIGRGYILSGYPLYPSTIGRINVDWAMPIEMAEREAFGIYSWPRFGYGEVQEGFSWVWPWAQRWVIEAKATLTYPLIITLLALVAYGVVGWLLSRNTQQGFPTQDESQQLPPKAISDSPPYWLALLPLIAGLIFWWWTAPDPRFARSLFWLLPVVATYFLLQRVEKMQWGTPLLNTCVAFVVVNGAFLAIIGANWSEATAISPGFMPAPRVQLIIHSLPGHLIVWEPVEDGLCWDSELPCTPIFNEFLRRRGETLQAGFTIITQRYESVAIGE